MTRIAGAVAIVTGAANGIGRATADSLARRGARLVLADIDAARLEEAAGAIRAAGGQALAIPLDLSEPDAFDRLRERTWAEYGTVDIVMNNVGVLVSGLPQDIPLAEWERIINLNLMGVVRSIHRFLPDLLAKGSGHIVNTASFAGLFPYAFDRLPYAATKGAIVTMTEGLALYLEPRGIGVTLLCPGPVRTAIGNTMRSFTEGLPLRGPGPQFAFREAGEVGEMVADAIASNRFFLPTDDLVRPLLAERGADMEAFLRAQAMAMAP
ncbi:SDR family oxidoreductase [Sphingobium sp. Sx8-8]|uniref:SDR family NAD(P)-dependent oxidoreductase n=1 Tax=Sphingobium sp. Sx8-8 TaxID=2933617 RepID=UPI001F5A6E10|nr:SDR family oxidoreductase [Sphingobium sp. Sx8-8]